ncbi:MAG TPA: signal recognition particle receptor subunit alpha, partial [Rhodocyclaceae bacterium]|nr:signal recognition particle receptor subunit alpha [Rhodocyclaceae bacterium]
MFGFLKKNETAAEEKKTSWTERLKTGLAKTRGQIGGLFKRGKIDDELLEELESTLLMADCGIDATQWLLTELKSRVKQHKLETPDQLRQALIELLESLLSPLEQGLDLSTHKPFIIMIAGVNGAG